MEKGKFPPTPTESKQIACVRVDKIHYCLLTSFVSQSRCVRYICSVFYNEVSTTEWKSLLKFSPWSLLSICLYCDSSYYESSYYDSSYWVGNRHIEAFKDTEEEEYICKQCCFITYFNNLRFKYLRFCIETCHVLFLVIGEVLLICLILTLVLILLWGSVVSC